MIGNQFESLLEVVIIDFLQLREIFRQNLSADGSLFPGMCVTSWRSFSTRTAARCATPGLSPCWSPASRDICPTSPPSPTASGAPPSWRPWAQSTTTWRRAWGSWTSPDTPAASTPQPPPPVTRRPTSRASHSSSTVRENDGARWLLIYQVYSLW